MSETQWWDVTWSPTTGCSPVSEGCRNCWAKRMSKRLRGRYGYPEDEPFRVTMHPGRLDQPLRWRKHRRVFVCSMGDLFHEDVPDGFIFKVWYIFRRCPQHTFIVLTKRPDRMARFMDHLAWRVPRDSRRLGYEPYWCNSDFPVKPNPLFHVWLGTSIEDQATADERIPLLRNTPAAKRFVSYEPALGGVDFDSNLQSIPNIDWVIMGGETGPGARPMHPDWARSVRDQCKAAGVPFWFKQMGEWYPCNAGAGGDLEDICHSGKQTGFWTYNNAWIEGGPNPFRQTMVRIGKKAAGHLLDGEEYLEEP